MKKSSILVLLRQFIGLISYAEGKPEPPPPMQVSAHSTNYISLILKKDRVNALQIQNASTLQNSDYNI